MGEPGSTNVDQTRKTVSNRFKPYNVNYEAKDPNAPFELAIELGNVNGKTVRVEVTDETTMRQVRRKAEGICALQLTNERAWGLKKRGKEVEGDKTVAHYNLRKFPVLKVVSKNHGGAQAPKESNVCHVFDQRKYPMLRVSQEPGYIMGYDEANNPRVALPCCGYALCAETIFQWNAETFRKDAASFETLCPIPGCGKVWGWDFIWRGANMTAQEKRRYGLYIANRATAKALRTYSCPRCGLMCHSPDKIKFTQCRCHSCGLSFCAKCEKTWKGKGKQFCGHTDCRTYGLVVLLRDCENVPRSGYQYSSVPKYRACPNCLQVVEHTNACKHMKCKGCPIYFCFLCLSIRKSDGRWSCGLSSEQCSLAPKQTLM